MTDLYLDANIFIFAALGRSDDPRCEKAKKFLLDIIDCKKTGCTSTLTVDEVVWTIIKQKKDRALAIAQGLRLHQLPVRMIAASEKIMIRSLHLMQKYPQLSPRDAIHAASCIESGAKSLVSDDSDFKEIKEVQWTGLF